MLSAQIKLYFDKHFKKPSPDFIWTRKENQEFFSFLEEKFPDEIDQEGFYELLKQQFEEFFEPIGTLLFQYKNKHIRMKITPYQTKPHESESLSALIEIIQKNKHLIDRSEEQNKGQISLKEELREKLCDFTPKNTLEEVSTKELLKYAVRNALELKSSDIVIVKTNQIFIKIFDDSKKREITKEEENSVAARYNGVNESELEIFYEDYFLEDAQDDFFYTIAALFVQRYFIEEQINNLVYEKFVFGYVQLIIIEQLETMYDYNTAFFKGFSGYVFRKHFKEVFAHMADLILSEIVNANKYMVEFIKYYSLNVVIVDGLKYKVPELQAHDGLRWNVVSMLSVVKVYVNTLDRVRILDFQMQKLKTEIEKLSIGEYSPAEYHEIYLREKQKLDDTIARLTVKYNKVFDAYEMEKNEDKIERLEAEIDKIKQLIMGHRERKNNFLKKALKRETLMKYHELIKNYEALEREKKREQRILTQNEESYLSIKSALTKALISKKQVI